MKRACRCLLETHERLGQHGTISGYDYHGCRCEMCTAQKRRARSIWADCNRDKVRKSARDWARRAYADSPDKFQERARRYSCSTSAYDEAHRRYRAEAAAIRRAKMRQSEDGRIVRSGRWTVQEKQILAENSSLSVQELAYILGRSITAVEGQRAYPNRLARLRRNRAAA